MFTRYPPAFKRLILGIVTAGIAWVVSWVVWGQLAVLTASQGKFGYDFQQYWQAATRFASGGSLYLDKYLHGPIPAKGGDYVYSPGLAQMLAPLTGLPTNIAVAAFTVLGLTIFVVTTWMCARAGGSRGGAGLTVDTVLLLAATFPAAFAVIFGNVEALLVAMTTIALIAGPARGGAALALGVVLKITPLALVPALAARSRRGLLAFALVLLTVVGLGFILAPDAWVAFPTILVNLASGKSDYLGPWGNYAPAAVVAAHVGPVAGTIVRFATLLVAGVLVLFSMLLARRPGGWPAALFAATFASLLVPATLWLHYPAILLPFIAFAWPRASAWTRTGIVCTLIFFYFRSPVLGAVGLILLGVVLLRALWPRTTLPLLSEVPKTAP